MSDPSSDLPVIRQADLRNRNAEVMRRVAAGEAFVITVHGRPIADLVPHQSRFPRRGVRLAVIHDELERLNPIGDADWGADLVAANDALDPDDPVADADGGPDRDPWTGERRKQH